MNIRDITSIPKIKLYLLIGSVVLVGILFILHKIENNTRNNQIPASTSSHVSVNSIAKIYKDNAKKALLQMMKNQSVKPINGPDQDSASTYRTDKAENSPTGIQDARVKEPLSPYLDHPLKNHPAYRIADRLANAREQHNEKSAEKALMDLFKQINLGVYTVDGHQILVGSERNQNDFFLYQYQVRILARSYVNWNVSSLNHELNVIPVVIFKMHLGSTNEALAASAVSMAMEMRYAQAMTNPDQPGNFIPLVIDGLARHQVSPYSLDELNDSSFSYKHADFDDIQTLLMMLDMIVPTPGKNNADHLSSILGIIPSAHAGSICDRIVGDKTKALWGQGYGVLLNTMQMLPKEAVQKVAENIGNTTAVAGAIGDLLILKGIYVKIVPNSMLIPLPHDIKLHKYWEADDLPQYHLKAIATFKVGISRKVAKCGWMIGKQIPKNGPLKNVEISWKFDPSLTIDPKLVTTTDANKPGVIGAGGGLVSGIRMLTGKDGSVTLDIGALPCPHPHGRYLNGRQYLVTAAARYLSAQMPDYSGFISKDPLDAAKGIAISMIPGFYEIAIGGRRAYARINVTWHEKNDPRKQQY